MVEGNEDRELSGVGGGRVVKYVPMFVQQACLLVKSLLASHVLVFAAPLNTCSPFYCYLIFNGFVSPFLRGASAVCVQVHRPKG